MRTLYFSIVFVIMTALLSSCSTTTTFSVHGEPGTEILTPNKKTLATIDNSGVAKITNPDDDYYAFLLSHRPGTNDYVPFALDYKEQHYPGSQFLKGTGIAIAGAGCFSIFTGLIALIAGEEDIAISFMTVGGIADLAGLAIGMPAGCRTDQKTHYYHYKYLSTQKTNQDIQITKPVFESHVVETATNKETESSQVSVSTKTLASSTAAKTLKSVSDEIGGTYVGTGKLEKGGEIIEEYNDIKVTVKKKSKDVVLVNVIESDGSKFFNSDGEYTVKKTSDGKYNLSLKDIDVATIKIDSSKSLIYIHPRVKIDNEIYTLNITASIANY